MIKSSKSLRRYLYIGCICIQLISWIFADEEKSASKGVKHKTLKNIEITAVNSTLQKGVKPAAQMNLEVTLKLLNPKTRPKPKPKPKPAPGGSVKKPKPKPKPVAGGKDSRRTVKDRRRILNSGS